MMIDADRLLGGKAPGLLKIHSCAVCRKGRGCDLQLREDEELSER